MPCRRPDDGTRARVGAAHRGPAAASEYRQAILGAARRLFTARGYHVPLKAVAKEAGIGQGVLYRHFPTRLEPAVRRAQELLRTPREAT